MFRKQYHYYQEADLDYPHDNLELPFSKYISNTQNYIKTLRHDAKSEVILHANSPFELRPENEPKAGVLLIHGLLDSPFFMRDIGETFRNTGFLVRAVLLPGHGTTPGALLNVKVEDWLQTIKYGVESLIKDVEKVFLVGFSTGATLALHHAIHDKRIAGLIMICPAFKILNLFNFSLNWHRMISHRYERLKWAYLADEIDFVKYQSIPYNAVYQVFRLIKFLKKQKEAACPLFVTLTNEDRTVSAKTTLNFFLKTKNLENKMLVYTPKKLNLKDPRIKIRSSYFPEQNILNFSHVSLLVAPNNKRYGKNGEHQHASRENEKQYLYCAVNKVDSFLYKSLYKMKFLKKEHKRLTYNPDYDYMMKSIIDFIHDGI